MEQNLLKIIKLQQEVIEELLQHKDKSNDSEITLNEEQAKKILCCLNNATFNDTETEEERIRLIDYNDEVSWDIADTLNIDINDEYINIESLEVVSY